MKLRLIVSGLLFIILVGSAAVAASSYSDIQGTEECALEMMEEFCTHDMFDSGMAQMMM